MENFFRFLGTAGIAALITGLFSTINMWKQSERCYIAEGRNTWINEMQDIAHRIQKANERNIGTVLVDLKVRLNPYGFIASDKDTDYYDKDSHIWNLIGQIEKGNQNNKLIFEEKTKLLVMYLTFLIKREKEQDERKVFNEMLGPVNNVLISFSLIAFSMGTIDYLQSILVLSMIYKIILEIIVIILNALLYAIFLGIPLKKVIEPALNNKVRYTMKSKYKIAIMVNVLTLIIWLFYVGLGTQAVMTVGYEYIGINYMNDFRYFVYFVVVCFMNTAFAILKWYELAKKIGIKEEYFEAIKKIELMQELKINHDTPRC